MIRRRLNLVAGFTLLAAMMMSAGLASAQDKKIIFAVPGIPPVFSSAVVYVAAKQGFFKKHGANVEIRPFDTGTGAARAVVAGDVDLALAPTPPVINQISNSGVPLVAIYGMANPDWVLVTTEAGKTCKDIVGENVGVDSVGGARSTALAAMLTGCPNTKMVDVKQVSLGSNVSPALIAGGLKYGVLHLDDLAAIEAQGRKLDTLLAMKNTNPNSHYLLMVVRKDKLAANRAAIVAVVAGIVEASMFMQDPNNADAVAEAATVTGHSKAVAKVALKQFLDIAFWPTKDDGLTRSKLESVAKLMKKIGAIKSDKEPVTFENLVDTSVWKEASTKVK